jgi:hypothetical protein
MTSAVATFVEARVDPRAEPKPAANQAAAVPVEREPVEAIAAEQTAILDEVGLSRLWLATQRRPWSSLALVPIGADVPTPRLAAALAEVGRKHHGGVIVVRDATALALAGLMAELAAIGEHARFAARAVIALPPLSGSPAGLALAKAADAVILCVALEKSSAAEAEQVLEDIGRESVLGSVILRERKEQR